MTIARRRLRNQHLIGPKLSEPTEVVRRLGAVQAQDYPAAKWALGLRCRGVVDAEVEAAFNRGAILRTHVLRPTWHFVDPADIRWLLALTGPRVIALNASQYRQLELDDDVCRRGAGVLTKALKGGRQLTRTELGRALDEARISMKDPRRLSYLMMRAELEGLICSGPRRGKQFTYALLDERVPASLPLERDEALATLAERYFTTRGPATVHDLAWWSGLTIADARRAAEAADGLRQESEAGVTWWSAPGTPPRRAAVPAVHLLPNYDEYFIGLRDRSAIGERVKGLSLPAEAFWAHLVLIDGQLVGGWRRTLRRNGVTVELDLVARVTAPERRAITLAAKGFGAFLELPAAVTTR